MKLKYLLLACAGLGLFTACESDEPSNVIAEYQKPTTFVLNTPQFANGVYDLLNAGAVNLTFSQPDYGYSAACTYTVQVSDTEQFASVGTVKTTFSVCDIDVDASEFAQAVCTAFGWEGDADVSSYLAANGGTAAVYVRVKSELSNPLFNEEVKDNEGNVTGTSDEIFSNAVKLTVLPYFALPPVELPTALYMNGKGDWANASAMVPVNGAADKFWVIRYADEDGFKFSFDRSEDATNFGFAGTTLQTTVDGLTFTDKDGYIAASKPGWYIFGVTTKINGRDYEFTVDVFPPDVWVYGHATGMGDGGFVDMPEWKCSVPDKADGEFVSPALAAIPPADSGLRLCVRPLMADGSQWGGDWWKTEFIFFDGKIVYRGNGGDQERVINSVGQKVYLNFAKGTAKLQ